MKKFLVLVLVAMLTVFFSTMCFAGSRVSAKPAPITIGDIAGVWNVTVQELLIVGGLGAKNTTNPATITFASDQGSGGSFNFVNMLGIVDFPADCAVIKKGAKIAWNIPAAEVADFEDTLADAIREWADENGRPLLPEQLPVLDILSYAYKPIVVIKNTGDPKLGILQVKGSVTMVRDDGNGGTTSERKNFKYKCQFAFTSTGPEPVVAADDDD